MIKKLTITALSAGFLLSIQAATLSPEAALARLGQSGSPATRAIQTGVPVLSLSKNTTDGSPALYVFNNEDEGYLVVSADDLAYPLLGYSDTGRITPEEVAENSALEWWLSEYARQIEYARSRGESSPAFSIPSTRADMEAINPLVTARWDQGAPYNKQCPLVGVERTYTGCVATAMAMVIDYWKYPEKGQGMVAYESETIGKRLSLDFSKKKIDWENMLDSYTGTYTEAQADAVAYLMKACGYAVRMDYGTDSSGALAMNIANGLKRYFNYDPNMLYTLREYYTASQWSKMIYDNLKEVGPLLYGGGSMLGGGHSFVCDGYDGNGMFHFNWGWSGMSDGYFSLDALNPEALGTGGGSGGGYNFTQDAVFGIQPPTGKPAEVRPDYMSQMGSLGAGIADDDPGVLHFDLWGESGAMWVNYNPTTMKVCFGAIFEPQGGTSGEVKRIPVSDVKFSIQAGYGTAPEYFDPKVDLSTAGLNDGTYKVTMATFDADAENPEWLPVKTPYYYYNFITLKKEGDKYEVTVDDLAGIGIESARIVGDFYYGCPVKVRVDLVNNSDIELTQGVAPAFAYNGTICFIGESVMVTLPPHSKLTKEWTTFIYAMSNAAPSVMEDTELLFTFFDETNYNLYTDDFLEEVVMKPNPGRPTVTTGRSAPIISGASGKREELNGYLTTVYSVPESQKDEVTVYCNVTLQNGYFNYPLYAVLLSEAEGLEEGEMAIESYNGKIVSMFKGTTTLFSTPLSLVKCTPGKLYAIVMAYSFGTQLTQIQGPWTYFRIIPENTGVDSVADDSNGLEIYYDAKTRIISAASEAGIHTLEVYDMQGRKIASAPAGSETVTIDGNGGMVIVRATDKSGSCKSRKLLVK